tara:strand:- start:1729 stop:2250 length:522 start_codon:yes stop_codon:yes gene_type:complete
MNFKEKILRFIDKIRYKLDKDNKPYELKEIDSIKKAKAMDFVLRLCMEYYINKESVIDFHKVNGKLTDELGLHSWDCEFILDVMADLGYINEDYKKNKEIEKIYCLPKGIDMFISGGFEPIARQKKREGQLIKIGQWSAGIVGVYYLATFLKEYFGMFLDCMSFLFCKICNLI